MRLISGTCFLILAKVYYLWLNLFIAGMIALSVTSLRNESEMFFVSIIPGLVIFYSLTVKLQWQYADTEPRKPCQSQPSIFLLSSTPFSLSFPFSCLKVVMPMRLNELFYGRGQSFFHCSNFVMDWLARFFSRSSQLKGL